MSLDDDYDAYDVVVVVPWDDVLVVVLVAEVYLDDLDDVVDVDVMVLVLVLVLVLDHRHALDVNEHDVDVDDDDDVDVLVEMVVVEVEVEVEVDHHEVSPCPHVNVDYLDVSLNYLNYWD